jgi:hypothetical protein
MHLEFFGIQLNGYSKCFRNYTKRYHYENNLQNNIGVVNWCSSYICLTQHFKLYSEDPKKFMAHGIAPIYTRIRLVYISGEDLQVCRGTEWLLSILSQMSHYSRSPECCPLHLQIFPEIQIECMPAYIGIIPFSMNFFRSSGYNLKC